jgi:hypothetical protein
MHTQALNLILLIIQLNSYLSWHIYPSPFKDRWQHIQSSMHLKSCRAANGILPVPSFQPHTTHKSTRTHWSQSYEDIPRGQTGNRRNGYRISVQYDHLKKNTWMKTLIQEAPIVNTSTTRASEDTRSQLQHAVINHLNGLENAILPTPLATQPHTAHRTT